MDETRYVLREFRDSDFEALAMIQNALEPDQLVSTESLRRMIESIRQAVRSHEVVVEVRGSGEVVATAAIFDLLEENDAKLQGIMLNVHPSRQRQGIGSALYDALVTEATVRKASRLQCRVRESSAAGRSFVTKRGFRERRRRWRSSLEVASTDTSELASLVESLASGGVEVTTLSHEGPGDLGVLQRVHDLDLVAGRDVPRDGAYTPPTFEQFRQLLPQGESFLPEAWFLAKHGDQFVGMSVGAREPAQPEVLQQHFTGVRPDFRRRGIARALKLKVIEYAKQHGYARIETWNDSLNAPMWGLNQELGFRKLHEVIQLVAVLPASADR